MSDHLSSTSAAHSPVARFIDKRLGIYDVHEVKDGMLVVHSRGAVFATMRNHTARFRLRDLDPMTSERVVPSRSVSNLLGLATMVGAIVVGFITYMIRPGSPAVVLVPMAWVVIAGLITLVHPFKEHVVYLRSRDGESVVGLPRAGRFKADRDAFLAHVRDAIRSAPDEASIAPTKDAPQEEPRDIGGSQTPEHFVDAHAGRTSTYELAGDRLVVDEQTAWWNREGTVHSELRLSDLDPLTDEAEIRDSSVTFALFLPLAIALSVTTAVLGVTYAWSEPRLVLALVASLPLSVVLARLHPIRRHVIYYRSRGSRAVLLTISASRQSRAARDAFVAELERAIERSRRSLRADE